MPLISHANEGGFTFKLTHAEKLLSPSYFRAVVLRQFPCSLASDFLIVFESHSENVQNTQILNFLQAGTVETTLCPRSMQKRFFINVKGS